MGHFILNFCQNTDKANKYKAYCSRCRRHIGVVGAAPMPFKAARRGTLLVKVLNAILIARSTPTKTDQIMLLQHTENSAKK